MSAWLADVPDSVPALLGGVWMTLRLLVLSAAAGVALSLPLALARLSRARFLSWPAQAYSAFFRGTPLLVQIYLIYYGLAQFPLVRQSFLWPVLRDAYACALIALSLNMAAYVGEVVRGGILAVPRGEREAGVVAGMSGALLYRRIILPRAFRLMLPALGNEVVIQMKATALASTITLLDLTGVARRLTAASYSTDPLLAAGAIYAGLTAAISLTVRFLERRLNRGLRARG